MHIGGSTMFQKRSPDSKFMTENTSGKIEVAMKPYKTLAYLQKA